MRFAVVIVVAAGCYNPTPPAGAPCAANNACPSGLQCIGGYCVSGSGSDGSVLGDAPADACPATACSNGMLIDCAGAHACPFGCASNGTARCAQLVPSNGLTPGLLTGATADVTGNELGFNTVTGRIGSGGGLIRAAGTNVINGIGFTVIDGMGVFTANSFSVPNSVGTAWTGTGTNTLVLYAATTIAVAGAIDAGALDATAGPGGVTATQVQLTACDGGIGRIKSAIGAGAGGGGAGGRTAGGNGAATIADSMGSTSGGLGGTACGTPSTVPLRGGHAGGAGGTESTTTLGGLGGGGGGALALVAMTSVTITGLVGTPGAGGATNANGSGGGGGGGGGAVFIEAPDVMISGAVTANGGGGGPPANATASTVRGQRGHLGDAAPASGATGAGASGGAGGALGNPSNGSTGTGTGANGGGGGGGGAAGAIEIRRLNASLSNAVFSPPQVLSAAKVQ